ncbi:IclR family transcriptional regulator [Tamaricihabitans halophyticus]|uniref:IclR family transcriptional regulator n=1 Tax=Tamaricihabitans halophyticus TaxID=1262583 RepID=A0A4R2QDH0_9PSEU|nr:IclR family transcriptional regulator [Tamaricihabitans halophyticus]TCP45041.1 IclR family transcriptional regulator [Tamaricihabitans halophyticus]
MAENIEQASGRGNEKIADSERGAKQEVAQPGTQTLIRGLRILQKLAEQERPVGVGELSKQLELPKSTMQRLLRTLEQEGWTEVSEDPITRWRLGPRLFTIVRHNESSRRLRDVALPFLQRLGEQTRETIHFVIGDNGSQVVLIERVDSPQAVRTYNPIGSSAPLHATSSGKAWLAMLSDDEVRSILARPLKKLTNQTLDDPEALMREVTENRKRGYAVNVAENRPDVCAIGAAVAGLFGRPVAAIAISVPKFRFEEAQIPHWGELVRDTAREISDALRD